MTSLSTDSAHREKARAVISSVLWSLFLTGIKIWAGLATNSLGILSEALHSGLDFCAAAITFYAVRMASRPADDDHQYGHEKVENLSALAETVLLLVTCLWIVWEALDRLIFGAGSLELTWWAFAVVAVSLAVDINRSAMLRRVAKEHKSQALEADAMHFTTDIYSSGVVLLGLVCVGLSRFVDEGSIWRTMLEKADAAAALFVAGIVCVVAWGLGKRSIHALMDGGSSEVNEKICSELRTSAPEYPLLSLRSRDIGAKTYVEMTIGTPPELHVEDAHEVTELMESLVRKVVPDADVFIHVEPCSMPLHASPDMVAHALAFRYHVRIHGFSEIRRGNDLVLFMDVEMPPDISLREGYSRVRAFQADLEQELHVTEVVLRIEPDKRDWPGKSDIGKFSEEEVSQVVEKLGKQIPDIVSIREIRSDIVSGAPMIAVHAVVPGSLSISKCHELASVFEKRIHTELSFMGKVAVILEPEE